MLPLLGEPNHQLSSRFALLEEEEEVRSPTLLLLRTVEDQLKIQRVWVEGVVLAGIDIDEQLRLGLLQRNKRRKRRNDEGATKRQ